MEFSIDFEAAVIRSTARDFPTGGLTLPMGNEILLAGCYNCLKPPRYSPSDGGYSPF